MKHLESSESSGNLASRACYNIGCEMTKYNEEAA